MEDEEAFEKYGDTPLYFSHYYNFLFVFKSEVLENGDQVFLQLGGNMEKVSALVVDAREPMTLNENGDDEIAHIKKQRKRSHLETGPGPLAVEADSNGSVWRTGRGIKLHTGYRFRHPVAFILPPSKQYYFSILR